MRKYYIILFFVIFIVIGVTVTSSEFFGVPQGINLPQQKIASPLMVVRQQDLDMIYQEKLITSEEAGFQLQPTVASTVGVTFIKPVPKIPNHFVSTVGQELISYDI